MFNQKDGERWAGNPNGGGREPKSFLLGWLRVMGIFGGELGIGQMGSGRHSGCLAQVRDLAFNDGGTLLMDCTQVNEGFTE